MRTVLKLSILSAAGTLALGLLIAPGPAWARQPIACNDVAGLIAAINAANTAGSGTITLASNCTYTLTAVDNTSANGPNGLPVISGDITIAGVSTTIARGAGAPSFRIFELGGSGDLTLDRITLRNGNPGATFDGGAVYVATGTTLTLNSGNVAASTARLGGGIFNSGTVTLSSSTLDSNTATSSGGGILTELGATATLTAGSAVSNNAATGGDGGGLWNEGTTSVETGTIRNNTAGGGGGGLNTVGGTVTITSSRLFGNQAVGNGGGIASSDTTVTVSTSMIVANSAADGGGIYEGSGSVTVNNSAVVGNTPNNCRPVGAVPNCTN